MDGLYCWRRDAGSAGTLYQTALIRKRLIQKTHIRKGAVHEKSAPCSHGGSAESFIIHADGRVVVDNASSQEKIYNFLAALKKDSDLSDGEIAGLQEDFRQGRSGAAECGMNGFLSKPIDLRETIQALQRIFERETC